MDYTLVQLAGCLVLYSLGVFAMLLLSHHKLTRRVQVFETRSLRLGLMAICTVLCSSAWRFWYVAVGQHETTWGMGLGTFVLIMAPIAWIYYKRKQDEGRGIWLTTKQG